MIQACPCSPPVRQQSPVKYWMRCRGPTRFLCRIVGVQAEQAPAYARSWQEGRGIVTETCDTIADGLATRHPLEANVHAIRQLVDEVRLVSECELLDAIRLLLRAEHVWAEAAGAASPAAFLQNPSAYARQNVVLLMTGANIPRQVIRRAVM